MFLFDFCGSRVLFMGPVNTEFSKSTLKLDPTALFTHLKIILLQYFQFSVISGIQTDDALKCSKITCIGLKAQIMYWALGLNREYR